MSSSNLFGFSLSNMFGGSSKRKSRRQRNRTRHVGSLRSKNNKKKTRKYKMRGG